jgi:hypothetical protein
VRDRGVEILHFERGTLLLRGHGHEARVMRIDQEEAAELLLRFGGWSVGGG